MKTQKELRALVEAAVKKVLMPPPIDDFQRREFRRMAIRFEGQPKHSFGTKGLIEQPHHYEERNFGTEANPQIYETKVYDDWDEDGWVERGKRQLLDEYAAQLYYAQLHIAHLTGQDMGGD